MLKVEGNFCSCFCFRFNFTQSEVEVLFWRFEKFIPQVKELENILKNFRCPRAELAWPGWDFCKYVVSIFVIHVPGGPTKRTEKNRFELKKLFELKFMVVFLTQIFFFFCEFFDSTVDWYQVLVQVPYLACHAHHAIDTRVPGSNIIIIFGFACGFYTSIYLYTNTPLSSPPGSIACSSSILLVQ